MKGFCGFTLNFRLFKLNVWLCFANIRFSASVVRTAPAVILVLSAFPGEYGDQMYSSLSIKLSSPVRIVATDHAAFHLYTQVNPVSCLVRRDERTCWDDWNPISICKGS